MGPDDAVFRRLQRHLDRQAIGFPAVMSGADLRFLKRLFTPEEARLALHLSCKPIPFSRIAASAASEFSAEQAGELLDNLLTKGAIGWKEKSGVSHWYLLPMVVGMYESQDGAPSPEFLADAKAYVGTVRFGKAFLAASPSQMRTIPIHQSIPVDRPVATYDQIRALVRTARGPFVVLKCICREGAAARGKPCVKTARQETCLGFGDVAALILRRGRCREITRDEVSAILQKNEEDGLVLQPANAQRPEFVCSCCGCCCGMLSYQKYLPHPVDFWTCHYAAVVDPEACTRCGKCVARCQVKAVALTGPGGKARIHATRCIGCGLCVPTCPSRALHLEKKSVETPVPRDDEELTDRIMANKKSVWARQRMALKILLRLRQ